MTTTRINAAVDEIVSAANDLDATLDAALKPRHDLYAPSKAPKHVGEPFESLVPVAGPAGIVPKHCRFCHDGVEHLSHIDEDFQVSA